MVLDPLRGSLTTICHTDSAILPLAASGYDRPCFRQDESIGLHRFVFVVADEETIAECRKGLVERKSISGQKLDKMAYAFAQQDPKDFRVYCLDVRFENSGILAMYNKLTHLLEKLLEKVRKSKF